MDTTRAQQQALDDELVAPADLALDAFKLTPFYNAFEIYADVPEIYMQEFWVTVSITRHFRFKVGCKSPQLMAPSQATNKKTDSKSSPKIKPSQASKGKRIKTSAKGDKPATTKSKGLTILSKVALSEAEQMRLVTKRSLKEFHISHASGLGDGVDILSKVPDEQQQTGSSTNEGG
ncbi:hypothetical protein Tco_0133766 [Tanacetum coccineum]